nr:unnamed protein product [Spirometra erinaceieuropaei]
MVNNTERWQTFDQCVQNKGKDCKPSLLWSQVPFLCGSDWYCSIPGNRMALHVAKRRLVDDYLLVGVTENFKAFMLLLETLLPRFATGLVQTANVTRAGKPIWHTRKTNKKYPISQATRDVFKGHPVWLAEQELTEMDPRFKYRKIQPINYNLLNEVREKTNQEMLMFDEKLSRQAAYRQEMKDDQTLRSHQQVWFEACRRVNECYSTVQSELAAIYHSEDLAVAEFENEKNLLQYLEELQKRNSEFTSNVIDPITTLRIDLKTWLMMREQGKPTTDPRPIRDLVHGMFASIAAVEKDLAAEEDALIAGNGSGKCGIIGLS